ncbi:MAG: dTMP kinase [Candidatus Aenigmatarchaeota archaeon]
MQGKFIVFEGITGSGKKAHLELLAEKLKEKGNDVVTLTFPDYESEVARLTKRVDLDSFTQSLLFAADRARHQERIRKFLEEGKIVLADRYCYSNFAYQSVKGVPLEWLIEIEKFNIKPDLVFLIDVPVEISMKRVMQSSIENFTKQEIISRLEKDKENLEKIREVYLKLAKIDKEAKWIVIDGSKEMSETQEEIWRIVSKELRI